VAKESPSISTNKLPPILVVLASIAAVLSTIAGIVTALAKIDEKGGAALHLILAICQYSGGFALMFFLVLPFSYFKNRFVALLASVAVFFFVGFWIHYVSGPKASLSDFDPDDPGLMFVSAVLGAAFYLYGLHSLAKRFGFL